MSITKFSAQQQKSLSLHSNICHVTLNKSNIGIKNNQMWIHWQKSCYLLIIFQENWSELHKISTVVISYPHTVLNIILRSNTKSIVYIKSICGQQLFPSTRAVGAAYRLWLPLSIKRALNLTKLWSVKNINFWTTAVLLFERSSAQLRSNEDFEGPECSNY